MLEAMLEGWRGKRVLIVGDRGGLCAFLIAVLDEIGARPVCVSDRADAQTLCRALTAGRVSAAILPGEMTGRSLPERLEATLTLTREVREAGVPLLLAMSDAAVYRGGGRMNEAGEIGGRTREGRRNPWFQAIKQHARWVTNRRNVLYHVPVDAMVKVTGQIPKEALPPVPTWVNELTWRPAA